MNLSKVSVDFEEKRVGTGAIFDEKLGIIGQKSPSYSSTLSFVMVSTSAPFQKFFK
jgi:hypothetical protein